MKRLGWRRMTFAGIASVLLGAVLLTLGVPRTIASWASLAAESTIAKLSVGQKPSDAELADGVAGLERALIWTRSGRRLTALALLELEQALRLLTEDPRRMDLLAQAERHLTEGLIASPTDGFAWMRLAFVREQRDASGREVAIALTQSLDMAPNVRQLWIPRAAMFLAYWRFLTVDELLAMRNQLRTIWVTDKKMRLPLLKVAAHSGQLPMISWALVDDPAAQAEFERLSAELLASPR
jgi:hypothetical protein